MNKKQKFNIAQKALQTIRLMLLRKDFSRDVTDLKLERLKLMLLAKDKIEKLDVALNFGYKIEKLLIKYELSSPHFIPLSFYILNNDDEQENIDQMFNHNYYEIKTDEYGNKTVYIPIYPETTIDDLRLVLPVAKKAYDDFYGTPIRKRVKRISQKHLKIIALKNNGHSNKDIKNKINKAVDKDDVIEISDVPTILNKLKKRSKIK